jgi:hypothetical protein
VHVREREHGAPPGVWIGVHGCRPVGGWTGGDDRVVGALPGREHCMVMSQRQCSARDTPRTGDSAAEHGQ